MQHFLRPFILIFVMLMLAACGGGGGGSSSSGGTPPPPSPPPPVQTDTLSLSQGAINFAATQFETIPDPVTVRATITGSNTAGIVFGTLPGVEMIPSWLDIQLGELVDNSVDAIFNITTTSLPEGTYSFTIRAVTFDANENVLDTADISVNFALAEGVPISLSPGSVDVIMHYASEPISQALSVTSGNYEWAISSSNATSDIESATGSQDVTLTISPPMEEEVDDTGIFQGEVLVFQNESFNSDRFLINYTMFPTLEYFGNDIILNAVAGNPAGQSLGINLRGEDLEWNVSADVPWLNFSATSGSIQTPDDVVDSPDGDDLIVTLDGSTLDEGRHTGVITLTANADQTLEIPVAVEIASQKLIPLRRGVALSQTATTSMLQSTVAISTNAERTANWEASSDAAWLSVTGSGTVADDLTLTVDPTLLMDETFTVANVLLSSPDSEISETETIRVGFWKSAMMPSDTPVAVGGIFPEDLIVADPVRPLVYVHSGETEINIVNVYTGNVEKTLTPSDRVFDFDVSDDGAFLYLIRSGEGEGFIDVVDLETQEISTTWSYPADRLFSGDTQDVAFGRISNRPYLFTSTGVILNAATGVVEPLASGVFPSVSNLRGDVFCASVDNDASELGCYDIISAGFEGARILTEARTGSISVDGQIVLTSAGDRLFAVANRSLTLVDASNFSIINTVTTDAEDFVEDAVLDSNNNLYVTYRNDGFVPTEPGEAMVDPSVFVSIYDADLNFLRRVDYPSNGPGSILTLSDTVLSGDAKRVVFLTDEGSLEVRFFSVD